MKRISTVLIILLSIVLTACNLQAPGGEPPVTSSPETVTLEPEIIEPTTEPTLTLSPTSTSTNLPPTQVPPTENLPTVELPTETPIVETQAEQVVDSLVTITPSAPTSSSSSASTFDPFETYGEPTYENPMTVPLYWEWEQAETDTMPDNQNIRLRFKDGNLYVTGKRKNFSTWWFSGHFLGDAYIEMAYDTEDCSGEDAYGMIVRGSPHKAGISYGYVVSFTCDGGFFMFRLDDAHPWTIEELEEADTVDAIDTGEFEQNVIGVRTEGDQLTVYANGVRVATVEDDHFEKGRVGVFVRSSTNSPYTYRVKNFAYWTLDDED